MSQAVRIRPTLRLLRISKGIRLQDLAREIGVYPQTVNSWERGDKAPRAQEAEAHARALGISIEDYLRLWREARETRLAREAEKAAGQ